VASSDPDDALTHIAELGPAAVFVEISGSAQEHALETLRAIRHAHPRLCLLAVASTGNEELVLAAFHAGATDYLKHSDSAGDLAQQAQRHFRGATRLDGAESMVGHSAGMRDVRGYIQKVAASDSNVLITGETGTGKELVAGLIHRNSQRSGHPLTCVNCAAIPDSLLESELFGFERGAFTGAHLSTPGKIETANGGTVFFDEIGEMSPYAQARLLRVIEERHIQRLGGRKSIPLNIRIVAATNRDLDTLAMEGGFRKDLYFRLNVARIHLSPLRERKPDIPPLIDHYVEELNRQFGASVDGVDRDVLEHLLRYSWPGNVRELKNLLEGIFVSRPTSRITFFDLPEWFRKRHPLKPAPSVSESDRLLSALHDTNWNKSEAAGRLNWSRMTLYRKMAKYGLTR
jgi:DNA-binding NtrC family response regulator